jgi:hypothetical protein
MKQKITKKEISDFRRFVLDSESCIEQLQNSLGAEGKKLNYSPESLHFIDSLLKYKVQKDPQKQDMLKWDELQDKRPRILDTEEIWLIVRIAYYFAEVLIQNLGAEWSIEDRPRHVNFKKAVLKLSGVLNDIEPLGLVLKSAKRENSQSLYSMYIYSEKISKEWKAKE